TNAHADTPDAGGHAGHHNRQHAPCRPAMTPIEFDAILFSARVAFLTVLLCFPVALLTASWTGQRGLRGRWVMDAVLLLPLCLSPAVIGWGVLSLAARDGMAASWLTQGIGPT